jgi:hypothetical protein
LPVWQGGQRVFLFVPSEKRPDVARWLPQSGSFLIAESGGKAVYSNQPSGQHSSWNAPDAALTAQK